MNQKNLQQKKGEQTPTKTCLAKNATTRRSNESPSNDEKKKIKKRHNSLLLNVKKMKNKKNMYIYVLY